MSFKVIQLPKFEYPMPKIKRQLARMHVNGGLIYDTYRALTEKQTQSFNNEDLVFDNIKNHWAFYIIDTECPTYVVAWGICIKGNYSEHPNKNYIIGHYYTREIYRGQGLGTILFNETVKHAKRNNCPLLVYPCNANKWYFRKMRQVFPDIDIQSVFKVNDQAQREKKLLKL